MNIGLIFGAIVALLLIGLILVFGYEQFGNITDLQNTAEMKKAVRDMETAADRVYSLSGESSEKVTLSFPASVSKVCFIPTFEIQTTGNGEIRVDYADIEEDLRNSDVFNGNFQERKKLAELVNAMRTSGVTGFPERNVLVFFNTVDAPVWYAIGHLGPSRTSSGFLCVPPKSQVWFRRTFDRDGAWVDVQEI